MHHRHRQQTDVLLFASIVIVAALTAIFGGLSVRQVSSVLGAMAFGALLYRSIPYWPVMTSLEHVMAILVGWCLVVGAVGSYRLDMLNAPPSGVIWYAIIWRVLVLGTCAFWPWLVGRTGTLRERLSTRRPSV